MPAENFVTPRDRYLFIVTIGSMKNAEEIIENAEFIEKELSKHSLRRALLDQRKMVDEEDVLDATMVADSPVMERMAMNGTRLACLSTTRNMEINRAFETILRNRSVLFKAFDDEAEAEAWLLG